MLQIDNVTEMLELSDEDAQVLCNFILEDDTNPLREQRPPLNAMSTTSKHTIDYDYIHTMPHITSTTNCMEITFTEPPILHIQDGIIPFTSILTNASDLITNNHNYNSNIGSSTGKYTNHSISKIITNDFSVRHDSNTSPHQTVHTRGDTVITTTITNNAITNNGSQRSSTTTASTTSIANYSNIINYYSSMNQDYSNNKITSTTTTTTSNDSTTCNAATTSTGGKKSKKKKQPLSRDALLAKDRLRKSKSREMERNEIYQLRSMVQKLSNHLHFLQDRQLQRPNGNTTNTTSSTTTNSNNNSALRLPYQNYLHAMNTSSSGGGHHHMIDLAIDGCWQQYNSDSRNSSSSNASMQVAFDENKRLKALIAECRAKIDIYEALLYPPLNRMTTSLETEVWISPALLHSAAMDRMKDYNRISIHQYQMLSHAFLQQKLSACAYSSPFQYVYSDAFQDKVAYLELSKFQILQIDYQSAAKFLWNSITTSTANRKIEALDRLDSGNIQYSRIQSMNTCYPFESHVLQRQCVEPNQIIITYRSILNDEIHTNIKSPWHITCWAIIKHVESEDVTKPMSRLYMYTQVKYIGNRHESAVDTKEPYNYLINVSHHSNSDLNQSMKKQIQKL